MSVCFGLRMWNVIIILGAFRVYCYAHSVMWDDNSSVLLLFGILCRYRVNVWISDKTPLNRYINLCVYWHSMLYLQYSKPWFKYAVINRQQKILPFGLIITYWTVLWCFLCVLLYVSDCVLLILCIHCCVCAAVYGILWYQRFFFYIVILNKPKLMW